MHTYMCENGGQSWVSICVCTCACSFVCEACVTWTCGGLRLTLVSSLITLHFIYQGRISQIGPRAHQLTSVANQISPEIPSLPSEGQYYKWLPHLPIFLVRSEIWTPVLTLAWQALYPLSCLPSPSKSCLRWSCNCSSLYLRCLLTESLSFQENGFVDIRFRKSASLLRCGLGGWSDSSVIQNMYYSPRRPWFDPQHPCEVAYKHLELQLQGNRIPLAFTGTCT